MGGLAGVAYVRNSYATGEVSGGGDGVGGLVGSGTVQNSYATGNVQGEFMVGGLVGRSESSVYASYATGDVKGGNGVGGLAGSANVIDTSYATGAVHAVLEGVLDEQHRVGGLAGDADTIIASYSTGRVTSTRENARLGGLVGRAKLEDIQVTESYWDTQSSGQSASAGGKGKTTKELQSPTDYTAPYTHWNPALWDFGTSEQYPALKLKFTGGDGKHARDRTTPTQVARQEPAVTSASPLTPAPTQSPIATSTPTPTPENADTDTRPLAQVFEDLVEADLLLGVWRYDNPTQSWAIYNPSIPAELNDLASVSSNDILWVGVAEDVQFQDGILHKGWNLMVLK